ncbi:MAG: SPOR domain-containing protein [Oceanidesulfovibrio sp.]
MHPSDTTRSRRVARVVLIGMCCVALLAAAVGCGKKTLDPARYGGEPASAVRSEPQVSSPPPQPDLQTPDREIVQEEAQPQAMAPDYAATEDVMVPVFKDVYQLASFSNRQHAEQFSRQAEGAGFAVSIEDAMVNGQTYYRVIGSIQGTEVEIRRAVSSLGVNPVQRSHERVEGRLSAPSDVQTSMAAEEPGILLDIPAAEPTRQYAPAGDATANMSAGAPAALEPEEPMTAGVQPEPVSEAQPVEVPPQPMTALGQPHDESQYTRQQDPLLGQSYRAPMRQPVAPAAEPPPSESTGEQTAAVNRRSVSLPQTKPTTPQRQSGIIPPSAPPTFIGSPTCQEKNGRLSASAVGRAEEPLRAERIAVDQAKRSLLLCVQAHREEAGLANGPRLTELPVNYLEISDPQRRPDGSVFVSVSIAVDDIPKLTAGR